MANTITLYDTIPGTIMGLGPIHVYKCVYDGTTGLETIRACQVSTNRIFVVQLMFADDTAGTINLGSNDDVQLPLLITTYQGLADKIERGWIFNTQEGETFKMGTTMATTIFVSVVEGARIFIPR